MFITKEDYNTVIYEELIDAITRDQDNILEKASKAAVQQAKGYLSRFDINALFSAEGGDRDDVLVMYVKDLAAWHFIALANANINAEMLRLRYEDAIRELGKIQTAKVVPDGWPSAEAPSNSFFHFASQPRRGTSY